MLFAKVKWSKLDAQRPYSKCHAAIGILSTIAIVLARSQLCRSNLKHRHFWGLYPGACGYIGIVFNKICLPPKADVVNELNYVFISI